MNAEPEIRRELRAGDLGRIVELHGRVYGPEYGVDASFEAMVLADLAARVADGWPGRGAVWLVDLAGEPGRLGGCLALSDEGDGLGFLRWFVLDPELRGRGLGRRMVGELIETAAEQGFQRLALNTFSELDAAARIYREHGFEVTSSEIGPRWGRERIDYRRYEAPVPVAALTRSA